VDAYPGVKFQGRVARKYPTIDPLNRTFQAEIEVPNPEQKLKVGGFAKVAIQTRLDNTVKTVPPQAIVSFAGVDKVFLVEGETARAVEVRIGMRERDWVEVMGEIPPGTSVITSGQTQLVDGSTIRIRE
jgi:RND family efflux transporter MFP subunit